MQYLVVVWSKERSALINGRDQKNVLLVELIVGEKKIACEQNCVSWERKTSPKSIVVVKERSSILSILFISCILFVIYTMVIDHELFIYF